MSEVRHELEHALPFAMEPLVYDFAINENGTWSDLLAGADSLMPAGYYALSAPALLRQDPRTLGEQRRAELDKFGQACRTRPELAGMMQRLFDILIPRSARDDGSGPNLVQMLAANGFDQTQHDQIRADLKSGRIGLAQNRFPASTEIKDVLPEDVCDARREVSEDRVKLGEKALRAGEVAVLTLAAGIGSRWTQGAGVVKALHPFSKLLGRHRTFLEAHLAKSRQAGRKFGVFPPHLISTSYLTHSAIADFLKRRGNYGYEGPLIFSPGRAIGLRLVPMARDLVFAWEEVPQQMLDEQAQKVRDSLRHALIAWACERGEGSDYTDNVPTQCLHPVGHWYEVPNLFRNGVLLALLRERPSLKYLLLHNIDTLGASLDPGLLGLHIAQDAALTFEVITRRLDDRGGGLARMNNRVRILEGLAMPREEAEFGLSYYNSMTTWISIPKLLQVFGLSADDLADQEKVGLAIRNVAAKLPTYVTLKEVKKRWGHGQEDIFPVAQFEKLWGDMSGLAEVDCRFAVVSRLRGQQLKDQAQLDGWLRDGSADYINTLCDWE
jgi:hypothetical protein